MFGTMIVFVVVVVVLKKQFFKITYNEIYFKNLSDWLKPVIEIEIEQKTTSYV